jgi:hypothetical protein
MFITSSFTGKCCGFKRIAAGVRIRKGQAGVSISRDKRDRRSNPSPYVECKFANQLLF